MKQQHALVFALTVALAVSAAAQAAAMPTGVIPGARDLGIASPNANLSLTIVLPLRNKAMLDSVVEAQANPASPAYHRWLSPESLQAYFLPTPAAYARTIAALRADGFRIVRTTPNRTSIGVDVSVVVAQRMLTTRFDRFLQDGHLKEAAIGRMRLPANLASIAGIIGLDDFDLARRLEPLRHRRTVVSHARYGLDDGYGPPDERDALDLPVKFGYDGRGVTVAYIGNAWFSDTSDIGPYLSFFGIKRTGPATTFVNMKACPAPIYCASGINDALLDVEHIVSNAPGVTLRFYTIAVPALSDIYNAVERIVHDNKSDVALMDYVTCEDWIDEGGPLFDMQMELGSALGITFVTAAEGISTGVGGSRACDAGAGSASSPTPPWMQDPQPRVNWPANSTHVLAVGGADYAINAAGHRVMAPAADWFTGGGVSGLIAMPAYQKSIPGMIAGGRNVPDIVGPAAVNGLAPSIYDYALSTVIQEPSPWLGGANFSSPVIDIAPVVAAIAEIDEMHHGRMGAIAGTLYQTYRSSGYKSKAFLDIVSGCNGEAFDEGVGPYCAAAGYDQASGIGAIDAYLLGKVLK